MSLATHRLVRFFTDKKTNMLYIIMPTYGILITTLLHFFGIYLSYFILANPAIMILWTFVTWCVEIAKIEYGDFYEILVVTSNLMFWIPLSRYVVIPLLDKIFCSKQ